MTQAMAALGDRYFEHLIECCPRLKRRKISAVEIAFALGLSYKDIEIICIALRNELGVNVDWHGNGGFRYVVKSTGPRELIRRTFLERFNERFPNHNFKIY